MANVPFNHCPVPNCYVTITESQRENISEFTLHMVNCHHDFPNHFMRDLYHTPSVLQAPKPDSLWAYYPLTPVEIDSLTIVRIKSVGMGGGNHNSDGRVVVCFYSLNGASDHATGKPKPVPKVLQNMTLRQFWYMVATGELSILSRVERDYSLMLAS